MDSDSGSTDREHKKARKTDASPNITEKGKAKAQPESTVTAGFEDPTADVVLVSSDEKAFRVHKYHLQAHSSVFREMIGDAVLSATTPADKTTSIPLCDPVTETAEVLRLFLSSLCAPAGEVFAAELEKTGFKADTPGDKAFKLAVKYDCPVVLREMIKAVRIRIMRGKFAYRHCTPYIDTLHAFILAAEQGLADECAALVVLAGRPDARTGGNPKDWSNPLDPRDLSVAQARKIPFVYFWALQSAWIDSGEKRRLGGRRAQDALRFQRASELFLSSVDAAKEGTDGSTIRLQEPMSSRKTPGRVYSDDDYDPYPWRHDDDDYEDDEDDDYMGPGYDGDYW